MQDNTLLPERLRKLVASINGTAHIELPTLLERTPNVRAKSTQRPKSKKVRKALAAARYLSRVELEQVQAQLEALRNA